MNRALLIASIGASTAIAALIDLATSAELVGSILFTFPLALCALSRSTRILWIAMVVTVLLTIAAEVWGFNRIPLMDHTTATANRALLIASLFTLALFIHLWINKTVKSEQQQKILVAQNERLEASMVSTRLANRELESFSYSVAHDLRAPLRGMNGFAQILLDNYHDKLDSDGRDWLNEIRLNATSMAALIDALLALARVTRVELKPEPVDLSTIARTVASELMASDSQRSVKIVIEDNLHAELDPQMARSLVDNLLGNAWKFTSKVAAARIEIGAAKTNGEYHFLVRDNGSGFDMAFADKLFTPFHRLHTVAEFPGTGVGLATVQRILQRHGGRIWATGAVDGGATFYFTVPSIHQIGELNPVKTGSDTLR